MTESYVQLAPDSTGKLVDTAAVIHPTSGATQQRQIIAVGDPLVAANLQGVDPAGQAFVRSNLEIDLLTQVLIELRTMNLVLASTLGLRDDLDALRADAASTV